MTLKYYLLKTDTFEDGIVDATKVGWVTVDDGQPTITPPTFCDLIPVTAYIREATYDASGEEVIEAEIDESSWFLASIQDGRVPRRIKDKIVAEWDAGQPIPFPNDIVAISPIFSGMV